MALCNIFLSIVLCHCGVTSQAMMMIEGEQRRSPQTDGTREPGWCHPLRAHADLLTRDQITNHRLADFPPFCLHNSLGSPPGLTDPGEGFNDPAARSDRV